MQCSAGGGQHRRSTSPGARRGDMFRRRDVRMIDRRPSRPSLHAEGRLSRRRRRQSFRQIAKDAAERPRSTLHFGNRRFRRNTRSRVRALNVPTLPRPSDGLLGKIEMRGISTETIRTSGTATFRDAGSSPAGADASRRARGTARARGRGGHHDDQRRRRRGRLYYCWNVTQTVTEDGPRGSADDGGGVDASAQTTEAAVCTSTLRLHQYRLEQRGVHHAGSESETGYHGGGVDGRAVNDRRSQPRSRRRGTRGERTVCETRSRRRGTRGERISLRRSIKKIFSRRAGPGCWVHASRTEGRERDICTLRNMKYKKCEQRCEGENTRTCSHSRLS